MREDPRVQVIVDRHRRVVSRHGAVEWDAHQRWPVAIGGEVLVGIGGPLGHTAVMAREFDIPAVVGADSLPLHLDGCRGELTVDRLRR